MWIPLTIASSYDLCWGQNGFYLFLYQHQDEHAGYYVQWAVSTDIMTWTTTGGEESTGPRTVLHWKRTVQRTARENEEAWRAMSECPVVLLARFLCGSL